MPRRKLTLTIARLSLLCVAAIMALLAVPIALGAGLPRGARYVGKTDQGAAVALRLTRDAKRVKRMRIHYTVTCDNGRSGATYTDILNARVRKDHSFRATGTYKGSGDGSENKFAVSGRLTARRARGSFTLTATGVPQGGAEPVHCMTGKLLWHARRAR